MRATAPWPRSLEDASRVTARLRTRDGVAASGALESFGERHVDLAFWDDRPSLPIGTEVDLSFDAPGMRDPVRATGEVRSRRDGDDQDARMYTVRISADRAQRDSLTKFFAAALNRRRSYRALPPTELDMSATLEAAIDPGRKRQVSARVFDISATGIALTLSHEADAALSAALDVGVHLPLTLHEDPVWMAARIRYRVADGSNVRYGIAFDAARTPGFRGQQDRIVREVMRWQRKTLTDVHRRIDFV